MGFLDQVIKVAKTAIWVSIAVFFVTCTAGALDGPHVEVDLSGTDLSPLNDIESVEFIQIEGGDKMIIHRKGEE